MCYFVNFHKSKYGTSTYMHVDLTMAYMLKKRITLFTHNVICYSISESTHAYKHELCIE